jgi:hypothetical protein
MTGFQTMTVNVRETYGQQRIYPVCQNAHEIAGMMGTKTITTQVIKTLKRLGVSVQIQQPEIMLEGCE